MITVSQMQTKCKICFTAKYASYSYIRQFISVVYSYISYT